MLLLILALRVPQFTLAPKCTTTIVYYTGLPAACRRAESAIAGCLYPNYQKCCALPLKRSGRSVLPSTLFAVTCLAARMKEL